jgi:heme/copper-type cytochrome/quinol oxidase subunit 2
MAILWMCALLVFAVFAVMIHSIATFRRGAAAGDGHSNGRIPLAEIPLAEILWAIVPIFIMVGTALPAVRMLTAEDAIQAKTGTHSEPLLTTVAARYPADRK